MTSVTPTVTMKPVIGTMAIAANIATAKIYDEISTVTKTVTLKLVYLMVGIVLAAGKLDAQSGL